MGTRRSSGRNAGLLMGIAFHIRNIRVAIGGAADQLHVRIRDILGIQQVALLLQVLLRLLQGGLDGAAASAFADKLARLLVRCELLKIGQVAHAAKTELLQECRRGAVENCLPALGIASHLANKALIG